jgi:anti-sigma-K factor RskA
MTDDALQRRATALETASAPADLEPDERAMVDRVRSVLAHPAVWMEAPDLPVHPAAIDAAPNPVPAAVPAPSPRRRRRLRWGLGTAAVAGLAAAVLAVTMAFLPTHETVRFDLAGTDLAPRAHASVTASKLAAGWHITLDTGDLPGAPADTYYQGWVVRGSAYVPLGTFHLRQPGDVELWAGVALDEYSRLEVTRQRVGGDQAPGELVLFGAIPSR